MSRNQSTLDMEKFEGKEYLTPQEVAVLLKVSPVTVRQWAQKGGLKAFTTPGGHRRFYKHDVLHFAANRGVKTSNKKSRKLLIVDDDVLLAGFLHEVFQTNEENYDVRVVHDGFTAGSYIQSFIPEVILLDIMMPGINGIQVCHFLKKNPATAGIRVVAMTGFPTNELVQEIIDAGADMCLHKPLKVNDVLDAVDSVFITMQAQAS